MGEATTEGPSVIILGPINGKPPDGPNTNVTQTTQHEHETIHVEDNRDGHEERMIIDGRGAMGITRPNT